MAFRYEAEQPTQSRGFRYEDQPQQTAQVVQEPATRKSGRQANLLDLLNLGTRLQAESSGRNISQALKGATFGLSEKVLPEPQEILSETLPSAGYQEKIADPAAQVVGSIVGAPSAVYGKVAPAVASKLGGKALGRVAGAVAGGAALGGLETPETGVLDIEERAKQAVTGGVTGGVMQGLGEGTKVASKLARDLPAKFINSLVKPRKTQLMYGANPGRTVAKKGITGVNLDDFAVNVAKAKDEVGASIRSQIEQLPQTPKNYNLLEPIDDAINSLGTSKRTNRALIDRLQDVKDDLMQLDDNGIAQVDLTNLTPMQAFDLKQQIADLTKFTGSITDDNKVNNALRKAYGKVASGLKKAAPRLEQLNEEYSDLITADKAVKERIANIKGQNIIGLNQQIGSVGLGGFTFGQTADPIQSLAAYGSALAVQKALASTAFKTNMAKGLSRMNDNQIKNSIKTLVKENPEVANSLKAAIINGNVRLTKKSKDAALKAF